MISFKDFKKLDIRIGTVVGAEVPEWSHWVIKLTTDFGPQTTEREQETRNREQGTKNLKLKTKNKAHKTVFAGLLGFYKLEELVGKQFPFVVNMEPKKIGPKGDVSEGMMLTVSKKLSEPVVIDNEPTYEKPVLLSLSEKVENGSKVC